MATEKIENPNEYGADQIQILEGHRREDSIIWSMRL